MPYRREKCVLAAHSGKFFEIKLKRKFKQKEFVNTFFVFFLPYNLSFPNYIIYCTTRKRKKK